MAKIKLTHRGGFRVFRDRVFVDTCKTEREAIEIAVSVKQEHPDASVRVQADYEVDVELSED